FPLPRGAVLGLWTILGSQQTAGERPPRRAPPLQGTRAPLPARLEVSCLCETAIQSQPTDKAMGSATAGLLRASDNHRAGGRRLVSPGPIRCRGRHRRRPRPYPQGGRRPDGHATAFGKGTHNCPLATDKSVGCTGASLKADAQDDEPMDTTPPSMAVIFRSPPAAPWAAPPSARA
ncbi:Transmembrane Protease Serine 7, partial [Manis pentadactyla]